MKRLITLLALVGSLISVKAADNILYTSTIGILTNNISTNRMIIHSLAVVNASTNVLTLYLYDNNVSANTYTNGIWYSRTEATGYTTNTWTNDLGVTNISIMYGLITTTVTNAAATNVIPASYTVIVPASSSASATGLGVIMGKGVTYGSDQTNVTLTLTYRPW